MLKPKFWTNYTPFLSVSPAKLARLKQAKEEVEKEIAEFRAQIELEFQRKVYEVRIRRGLNFICLCTFGS